MVQSGTELKGTVIVPLISVGTKHKGELTCVTEGAGNAQYESREERNLGLVPRQLRVLCL